MTTQDSVDYHTELFNRVSYYFLAYFLLLCCLLDNIRGIQWSRWPEALAARL